jgi:hypothetical protein
MDFSCFAVSGGASGSAFAAAVIALSCSAVGISMRGRLDGLDIMFHLSSIGPAKADDPSHFVIVNESYVVKNRSLRRERDHSHLTVLEPVVDPNQRSFPIEFARQGERNAMLRSIRNVLDRIEFDLHRLL